MLRVGVSEGLRVLRLRLAIWKRETREIRQKREAPAPSGEIERDENFKLNSWSRYQSRITSSGGNAADIRYK
jgi:hypothetical protein